MTAERYRVPPIRGVRTAGGVLNFGLTPAMDLFDQKDANLHLSPHPDFAARAAIWRDHSRGLISLAEAQRRSSAVVSEATTREDFLPVTTRGQGTSVPRPRHTRPAPNDSRQYAGEMATTAARDDRLTPNAKSLLQVLRARCGKGRRTEITKGTMGAVMSRSARTVRRYLVDLVRFGYVELEIRRTLRGLHTGLVVMLTEKALPFFEDAKGLAAWLAETPTALAMPFTGRTLSGKPGVTLLSLKNQFRKFPLSEVKFRLQNEAGRRVRPPI